MNLLIGDTEKTIKRMALYLGIVLGVDIVTRVIGWFLPPVASALPYMVIPILTMGGIMWYGASKLTRIVKILDAQEAALKECEEELEG